MKKDIIASQLKFRKDFRLFKKLSKLTSERFQLDWSDKHPCLDDNTGDTPFDHHYIYHTAWAARKLKEINPKMHTDVSSFLYFSTIVSAFVPVEFYDLRPAKVYLSNLKSNPGDILGLPIESGTVESLSCMHTIEHVGLGRYGDEFDYDGDIKAIDELQRVLAKNGHLLFVVPVGKPKIMFNAHRVYSYNQIISYFSGLKLKEFSLIPGNNKGIIYNANSSLVDNEDYGCGCFWFIKR